MDGLASRDRYVNLYEFSPVGYLKGGDAAALAVLLPKFEQELAGVEGFLEGY